MRKHKHLLKLVLVGLFFALGWTLLAQDSVCAAVKIEIRQELTLERQAFDARMRINNGYANLSIEDIDIDVSFTDEHGSPVVATSDPNNLSASFFIRVDSMENISDVNGNGTVAPSSFGEVHWLIIPAPGAGGSTSQGKLYYTGAMLRYNFGGEAFEHEVVPDFIYVKPMPELILDYFLPHDVYGDDAFTPQIEAPVPFFLGVRVRNSGAGVARNVAIDSGQPKIVENEQGLLVGFQIEGSEVNGEPASASLKVQFGDIHPNAAAVGRWIMTTSLSGRFVAFGATFSHADELGGVLTSLIETVNTHELVGNVLVDLPGRDPNRDFLANDNGTLRVYESETLDTVVQDLSGETSLSGAGGAYEMSIPVLSGFVFVKLPDPTNGITPIQAVERSDGKRLAAANAWLSKTWDKDGRRWNHYINLFDVNPLSANRYRFSFENSSQIGNQPPVLGYIGPKTARIGRQLGFIVEATDPNGGRPQFNTGLLPSGLSFTDRGDGIGRFEWFPGPNQVGVYSIKLTASDGELEDSETFQITVTDQDLPNQAPLAFDQLITPEEDIVLRGSLSASDPDGDPLQYQILSQPANGSVTLLDAATGSFEFVPHQDETAESHFTFKAADGEADSNIAAITLQIRPLNDKPTAAEAQITTVSGQPSEPLSPTVIDPDLDDSHSFAITALPHYGTAEVVDNQLVYTSNPSYAGHDSFTFSATDSGGLAVTGTADVEVLTPLGDLVAANLVLTKVESGLQADFTVENTGEHAIDGVRVALFAAGCDGPFEVASSEVSFPPGMTQMVLAFEPSQSLMLGPVVISVAIDPEGVLEEKSRRNNRIGSAYLFQDVDPASLTLSARMGHHASYCATGEVVFSGQAAYQLSTASGQCAPLGAAGIGFNYQIVRASDQGVLAEGVGRVDSGGYWHIQTSLPDEAGSAVSLRVTLADQTVSAFSEAGFELVTCPAVGGTVPPLPDIPFPGPDGGSAVVVINSPGTTEPWLIQPGMPVAVVEDGRLGGSGATGSSASVVEGGPALGSRGGAVADAAFDVVIEAFSTVAESVVEGQAVILTGVVHANDSYYGLPLRFQVSAPSGSKREFSAQTYYYLNGTLHLAASVRFPVAGDYHVALSLASDFTDAVADNNQASLDLAVLPSNRLPVAENLAFDLAEDTRVDGFLRATDPDGDALTYRILTQPFAGTLTLDDPATGAFTFIPQENFNGSDSFTYNANDGVLDANPATVNLTIQPVNDAPVAQTMSLTTEEDTVLTDMLRAVDEDGDALTFQVATQSSNGSLTLNDAATGAFTYVPEANFSGADTFSFSASDGQAQSDTVMVSLNINPVNDAPIAQAATFQTLEDTTLDGQLTGTDLDGDSLSFLLVQQASEGSVTLATDGRFSYTHNQNFNGIDSFSFKLNDGDLDSEPAQVQLSVEAVNHAPTASSLALQTEEDTFLTGSLPGEDVDGDALLFSILLQPILGTVTLDDPNTGAFTYTPGPDANGPDSFRFQVDDGTTASASALVSMFVNAVNDAPVADDAQFTMQSNEILEDNLTGTDVDGDHITFTLADLPDSGTLEFLDALTGAFRYTPFPGSDGEDQFSFTVDDGRLNSGLAVIRIQVGPEPLGLVAQLPMDEGSGNQLSDGEGNVIGTLGAGVFWENQAAAGDAALHFDGSNQAFVNLGQRFNFDHSDPFTISTWFSRESTIGQQVLIAKQYDNQAQIGWALEFSDKKLRFSMIRDKSVGNGFLVQTTHGDFNITNIWQHLAVTYDGSSSAMGVAIYLDGVPLQLMVLKDDLTGSILSTANTFLGKSDYGTKILAGFMDELQVYDYALNTDEVARKADYGLLGLRGYYPFNGNLLDSSESFAHARPSGTAPVYEPGTYELAVSLSPSTTLAVNKGAPYPFHNSRSSLLFWLRTDPYQNQTVLESHTPDGSGSRIRSEGGNLIFELYIEDLILELGRIEDFPSQIWTHVAAVRDGNTFYLYQDGLLDHVRNDFEPGRIPVLAKADVWWFAQDPGMEGALDEVALYARPVDESEILAFSFGKNGEGRIGGWYDFEAGTPVVDTSLLHGDEAPAARQSHRKMIPLPPAAAITQDKDNSDRRKEPEPAQPWKDALPVKSTQLKKEGRKAKDDFGPDPGPQVGRIKLGHQRPQQQHFRRIGHGRDRGNH